MWTQSYTSSYMMPSHPDPTEERTLMSDRYQGFTQSPIGKLLVKNLGLPSPARLERYAAGAPLVDGTVVVGGRGRLAESLPGLLDLLGIASTAAPETADADRQKADSQKYKGLVFD